MMKYQKNKRVKIDDQVSHDWKLENRLGTIIGRDRDFPSIFKVRLDKGPTIFERGIHHSHLEEILESVF